MVLIAIQQPEGERDRQRETGQERTTVETDRETDRGTQGAGIKM